MPCYVRLQNGPVSPSIPSVLFTDQPACWLLGRPGTHPTGPDWTSVLNVGGEEP